MRLRILLLCVRLKKNESRFLQENKTESRILIIELRIIVYCSICNLSSKV